MFWFTSLKAMLRDIKSARDDIRTTREDLDRIKGILRGLPTRDDYEQLAHSGLSTREDVGRIKEVVHTLGPGSSVEIG